ncbi:MAG: hypothetical protein H7Y37_15145 [Anaerolineae bacterium]|nr:hypothetical protein [Gloeobacterales cyanobacterium ES-bin-313]
MSTDTIAVLFRHQDTADQAVADLKAANFSPEVIDKDQGSSLEGLSDKLTGLGLSADLVQYFVAGAESGKILVVLPGGEQNPQALKVLKPRGGDYGSGFKGLVDETIIAFSLDDEVEGLSIEALPQGMEGRRGSMPMD